MCGAHATVRGVLSGLMAGGRTGDGVPEFVVVDMEAGLEHLSRATARHVDVVVPVVEPYFRAMEAARRVMELARELEIDTVSGAVNKIRGDADREVVAEFCRRHSLPVALEIPYDDAFLEAERAGVAPIEHAPASPGVRAVTDWADALAD